MASENVRRRREKRRYTFILVSSDESSGTKTFSIGRWGIAWLIFSSFIVISAVVTAILLYTPVRRVIPIRNSELEERYGTQIGEIQERLVGLVRQLDLMREYNRRLRFAMGERASMGDTTLAADAGAARIGGESVQDIPSVEETPAQDAVMDLTRQREGTEIERTGFPSGLMNAEAMGMNIEFPLTVPAVGFISREFNNEQFHFGIDIAGRPGSPVIAAAEGTVVFADWTYAYGYTVMLAHGQGFVTVYKHNQSIIPIAGATVKRGEVIALLGDTGETSSGPHLHFEVWKNGFPEDPNNYLLTTQ